MSVPGASVSGNDGDEPSLGAARIRSARWVGSDPSGSLAQGALEPLRQVGDRFACRVPVRTERRRLVESSTGMLESGLEEVWIFGQLGNPLWMSHTGRYEGIPRRRILQATYSIADPWHHVDTAVTAGTYLVLPAQAIRGRSSMGISSAE